MGTLVSDAEDRVKNNSNESNNSNNNPPWLAGLTYRWGSVASQVLTLVGDLAGGAWCQPELPQSDTWSTITSVKARAVLTSRAPHHGECLLAGPVDAEEVAGVEIVLLWAVPNVSAELASWAAQRSQESLGRTPSRSGWRWQAVVGRRAVAVGGSAVGTF